MLTGLSILKEVSDSWMEHDALIEAENYPKTLGSFDDIIVELNLINFKPQILIEVTALSCNNISFFVKHIEDWQIDNLNDLYFAMEDGEPYAYLYRNHKEKYWWTVVCNEQPHSKNIVDILEAIAEQQGDRLGIEEGHIKINHA